MLGIPKALMEYLLPWSNDSTGRQYTLFCRISSSPPTFVVVTEVSFSFNPKVDAVSFLIKLTWAPVWKRIFACFWTVNICGNYRQKCAVGYRCICHWVWWYWLHQAPFFAMVHCCLWVQFAALWSRPGLLTQLNRTWFSLAIFSRSSMPRAANLGHWSGQWVGFLHSQHLRLFCLLSISPLSLRWLTWRWLVDRTGAVARMRDFISNPWEHSV